MPLDRVILEFLRDYWGAALPSCSRAEVGLLGRVFSPGVRDKSLRQRQCRQTAKILEPFLPGILGHAPVGCLEDLVSLVVDVTGRAYYGESFISLQ
jgi:hypothetical protein